MLEQVFECLFYREMTHDKGYPKLPAICFKDFFLYSFPQQKLSVLTVLHTMKEASYTAVHKSVRQSRLTLWRRNFLLNLTHPVFKM